jgi:hypothetical protein
MLGYSSGVTPVTSSMTSAATESDPVPRIRSCSPAMPMVRRVAEPTAPSPASTSRPWAVAESATWAAGAALGCLDRTGTTVGDRPATSAIIPSRLWPLVAPKMAKTRRGPKCSLTAWTSRRIE